MKRTGFDDSAPASSLEGFTPLPQKGLSLRQAIDAYLTTLNPADRYFAEAVRYRKKTLGLFRKPAWSLPKSIKLAQLSNQHLTQLVAHRREEGLSPASINRELAFLRSVINFAVDRLDAAANPRLRFRLAPEKPRMREISWTEQDEIEARLQEAPQDLAEQSLCLLRTLVGSGARVSEVLGLQWRDIDFREGLITLTRLKGGKTSYVPLDETAAQILKRWQERGQGRPFEGMEKPRRLLLQTIHEVCNQDPDIVERYGKAVVHSLRDTFACRLLQQGAPRSLVQEMLGHASARMTEKYARYESRSAAKQAQDLIRRPPPQ